MKTYNYYFSLVFRFPTSNTSISLLSFQLALVFPDIGIMNWLDTFGNSDFRLLGRFLYILKRFPSSNMNTERRRWWGRVPWRGGLHRRANPQRGWWRRLQPSWYSLFLLGTFSFFLFFLLLGWGDWSETFARVDEYAELDREERRLRAVNPKSSSPYNIDWAVQGVRPSTSWPNNHTQS